MQEGSIEDDDKDAPRRAGSGGGGVHVSVVCGACVFTQCST